MAVPLNLHRLTHDLPEMTVARNSSLLLKNQTVVLYDRARRDKNPFSQARSFRLSSFVLSSLWAGQFRFYPPPIS